MNDLKKYAGLLNDVAPKNHLLAYITPSERDMLVDAGGVKTSTPSGIFAYPPSNDARGQSTGSSSSSNSGGGGGGSGRGGSGGGSGNNNSPGTTQSGGNANTGGGSDAAQQAAQQAANQAAQRNFQAQQAAQQQAAAQRNFQAQVAAAEQQAAQQQAANRESYRSEQYNTPTPIPEIRNTGYIFDTPPQTPPLEAIVDPGFQRALAEIAYQQQNPVYGDPDPQVDVSPQDRDSITSFFDNYKANVKSNPYNLSTLGALKTLYQTNQARNMMSGVPGYEFLGYTGGNGNTTNTAVGSGGGGNALQNLLISSGLFTPQQSMVNDYFANQPSSSISSSLQTSYNDAKSNINNILGISTPSQQFGYSQAPYGNLSNVNMTNNPYNIDYLKQLGLI